MVINVSHASDEAISQAIEVSTDPVIATHHGLREFNDIPRNMPDWLLEEVGRQRRSHRLPDRQRISQPQGLRLAHPARRQAVLGHRRRQRREPMSIEEIDKIVAPQFPMLGSKAPDNLKFTVDDWLKVTDRAIQLVGEDHVILGTDFDGGPTLPLPMRDIRDVPLITAAMRRRGYSEQRIGKIMGGNLLRVIHQITDKHHPALVRR